MSEQVNVSVNIDPDEIKAWAENHINGIPASVAHVLFAAHDLYAGMETEWAVRYEKIHNTKYQPPSKNPGQPWSGDKWVRCDPYWMPHETDWYDRDEAERRLRIYSRDYGYPRYRNARLVRRYVTGVIDGE